MSHGTHLNTSSGIDQEIKRIEKKKLGCGEREVDLEGVGEGKGKGEGEGKDENRSYYVLIG